MSRLVLPFLFTNVRNFQVGYIFFHFNWALCLVLKMAFRCCLPWGIASHLIGTLLWIRPELIKSGKSLCVPQKASVPKKPGFRTRQSGPVLTSWSARSCKEIKCMQVYILYSIESAIPPASQQYILLLLTTRKGNLQYNALKELFGNQGYKHGAPVPFHVSQKGFN